MRHPHWRSWWTTSTSASFFPRSSLRERSRARTGRAAPGRDLSSNCMSPTRAGGPRASFTSAAMSSRAVPSARSGSTASVSMHERARVIRCAFFRQAALHETLELALRVGGGHCRIGGRTSLARISASPSRLRGPRRGARDTPVVLLPARIRVGDGLVGLGLRQQRLRVRPGYPATKTRSCIALAEGVRRTGFQEMRRLVGTVSVEQSASCWPSLPTYAREHRYVTGVPRQPPVVDPAAVVANPEGGAYTVRDVLISSCSMGTRAPP